MNDPRPCLRPLVAAVASAWLAACGGGGSGSLGSSTPPPPASSDAFTWVAGASTAGAAGSYGTEGTAAAANTPGARNGPAGWRDAAGNLWLFGGLGYDGSGAGGDLNDLWRFSPVSGQWTWVGGASSVNGKGIYGTQNATAAANTPGARESAVSWVDAAGTVWLFGGAGYDSAGASGALSDLWQLNPASAQWTWVGGASTVNATGAYGVLGVAAPGNAPGAREVAASWLDGSGNLWLFGGVGYDGVGGSGDLNDLWVYSPSTGQWTWVSGAQTANAVGVYGTRGTPAAGNAPGARYAAIAWTDAAGNLWLLGGSGYDSAGTNGSLSDLWEFSPSSGQWTWVGGSAFANTPGSYGTQGTAAAGNWPGGREAAAAATDASGNLWLSGGVGFDGNGTSGYLGDLWKLDATSGQWTWIAGAAVANVVGVYGTQGSATTATIPGGRFGGHAWFDATGALWLFGGQGIDGTGAVGVLNDLWKYAP